jgi:hypothetical protein
MKNIQSDAALLFDSIYIFGIALVIFFLWYRVYIVPRRNNHYVRILSNAIDDIQSRSEIFQKHVKPETETLNFLWSYYMGVARLDIDEYIHALQELPIEYRERRIQMIREWLKCKRIYTNHLYLNSLNIN